MMSQISSPAYQCPDCQFKTSSQGGLSVHHSKKHLVEDLSIKSVSVVRAYPEGKKFRCCLCDNIISSFPNFKHHFVNIHPNTLLNATGFCSIRKVDFKNAQALSIHCKCKHGISKKKASKFLPPSLNSSPIMSYVDNDPDVNHIFDPQINCELDQSSITNDSSLPCDFDISSTSTEKRDSRTQLKLNQSNEHQQIIHSHDISENSNGSSLYYTSHFLEIIYSPLTIKCILPPVITIPM